MKLRPFEQQVSEAKGNAQDIIKENYNRNLSYHNSKKYLAGIRMHLDFIKELEETAENIDNELISLGTEGNIQKSNRLIRIIDLENKTNSELLRLHNFDPAKWELVKSNQSMWHSPVKDGGNQELYSSKIEVRPTGNELTEDQLKEIFSDLEPPELEEPTEINKTGLLLELPMMDLHLGKLAWNDETGQNYKLQIASKLYKRTISDMINQVIDFGISPERILFPIGQDFFHFDTDKQTTTAGTQMNSDTRWQKMFSTGVELAVWAVTQLSQIAPVDCIYVASNHDKVMSYCLTHTVAAWFRKSERVTVDISPNPQKYYDWGKVLIGYSHGDKEGKRIDVLMQADVPKLWGKTIFREWHLGHLHSEQVREIAGVIIRNMASITSIDSWHTEHGYRSLRKAQAILWDKEIGKRLTIDVNVMV